MFKLNALLGARSAAGVNVAVLLTALKVTLPGTTAPPGPVSVMLPALVMDSGSIASLNVTLIGRSIAAPTDPHTGKSDTTCGKTKSPPAVVVNPQTNALGRLTPATVRTAVVTDNMKNVSGASGAAGWNVAMVPVGSSEITPATATPPGPVSVNVVAFKLAGSMGVLN